MTALITPSPGTLVQHVDGGLYRVETMAKSSEDASLVVVYRHLWPFEPDLWTRPLAEWDERFAPITVRQAHVIMSDDPLEAQLTVATARQLRRAKAAKAATTSKTK